MSLLLFFFALFLQTIDQAVQSNSGHWIHGDSHMFGINDQMLAFIVKDEEPPDCETGFFDQSITRYFMCSGVLLDKNHVLTTASCLNLADLIEYHIHAEVAVLLNAFGDSSLVGISNRMVHPKFDPDLNSPKNADNNLAILTLACPVTATFPDLPRNSYDDLGHLCCSDGCTIISIAEDSENRINALEKDVLYLPSAKHSDQKPTGLKFTSSVVAPLELSKEDWRRILRELNEDRVHDNTKMSLKIVANHVTSNIVARIRNTMIDTVRDFEYLKKSFHKILNKTDSRDNIHQNEEVYNDFSKLVSDEALRFMLKSKFNVSPGFCPPLGTPVIKDNILISLIAYTCNEDQPDVPWKYVSIKDNVDWIKNSLNDE